MLRIQLKSLPQIHVNEVEWQHAATHSDIMVGKGSCLKSVMFTNSLSFFNPLIIRIKENNILQENVYLK